MFKKTRAVKRFVRRNKTKFFVFTTVVATGAMLNEKSKADLRGKFIADKDLTNEYESQFVKK